MSFLLGGSASTLLASLLLGVDLNPDPGCFRAALFEEEEEDGDEDESVNEDDDDEGKEFQDKKPRGHRHENKDEKKVCHCS